MVTQRKIIFVHQAKAGGTTLVHSLMETYGRESMFHDEDARELTNMPSCKRRIAAIIQPYRNYSDREKYGVIHGHFIIAKYKVAFPSAFYLTFYRHPLERVVSTYRYWLRTPQLAATQPLCRWLHAKKPDISEFAVQLSADDDHYCRYFDPAPFDFVGITERQDDSMQMLKLHIPELKTDVQPQRQNPEKPVGEKYQLSNSQHEELSEIMKKRMDIYNAALSRFNLEWESFLSSRT